MLAAMRRASSRVSSFAVDLRRLILEINIGELLAVVIADDETGVQFLDGPRRRGSGVSRAVLSVANPSLQRRP
jgi:hypothetical protein